MEYITFMHSNTDTESSQELWDAFFKIVRESGLFRGGSAIGARSTVGTKAVPDVTHHIDGYMRFDADDLEELEDLLKSHPTIINGGTIEVCELPKS